MAGDPKQLAPTIISMDAAKQGLGTSLFERLLADYGDEVKRMLKEQYRMHETIMRFPSDETYGGPAPRAPLGRRAHRWPRCCSEARPVDAPPVLFLDTAGKGFDESEGAADRVAAQRGRGRAGGRARARAARRRPRPARAGRDHPVPRAGLVAARAAARSRRARGRHRRRLPGPREGRDHREPGAQQRRAAARLSGRSAPPQRGHHPPAAAPLRRGRFCHALAATPSTRAGSSSRSASGATAARGNGPAPDSFAEWALSEPKSVMWVRPRAGGNPTGCARHAQCSCLPHVRSGSTPHGDPRSRRLGGSGRAQPAESCRNTAAPREAQARQLEAASMPPPPS